ncbi:tRNA modification GTPase MnmE [Planctomycetes bacterium Pla86]|uniref:tRNA modification GTPase MnmE n=2 Tax=Engelhardtia mirabilis TaxID=2528011 RepID=A0A518BJD2_9BACT|nr:tRNA modification GTPase MnmE [Planctomycetes bacterium Pla133]QDV01392.1 tRNA modification GTPase MnmE [Planctomycetes bacterium Pla86]
MPGPASYTREDVCELHLPGSVPLLERALDALLRAGARRAEPGEFTRRAFHSGRLDLTRAEGVLELVRARSEDERRAATALLGGGLGERVASLRDNLDGLRALCEASLDFDESDTGHVDVEELLAVGERARGALTEALGWEQARPPRAGLPRVALVGAPNAGKSSLFNRLGRGAAAIVSDLAGTTRDALQARWGLDPDGGGDVELLDLAGLDRRDARGEDPVPRGAQDLARRFVASADLVLWVVDGSRADAGGLAAESEDLPVGADVLVVWNQIDRIDGAAEPAPALAAVLGPRPRVAVSAATGVGIEALREAARRAVASRPPAGSLARELAGRHRIALERGLEALGDALALLEAGGELDLVAGEMRRAVAALDEISGRTSPEDLLDRIFARFCIGK